MDNKVKNACVVTVLIRPCEVPIFRSGTVKNVPKPFFAILKSVKLNYFNKISTIKKITNYAHVMLGITDDCTYKVIKLALMKGKWSKWASRVVTSAV